MDWTTGWRRLLVLDLREWSWGPLGTAYHSFLLRDLNFASGRNVKYTQNNKVFIKNITYQVEDLPSMTSNAALVDAVVPERYVGQEEP